MLRSNDISDPLKILVAQKQCCCQSKCWQLFAAQKTLDFIKEDLAAMFYEERLKLKAFNGLKMHSNWIKALKMACKLVKSRPELNLQDFAIEASKLDVANCLDFKDLQLIYVINFWNRKILRRHLKIWRSFENGKEAIHTLDN